MTDPAEHARKLSGTRFVPLARLPIALLTTAAAVAAVAGTACEQPRAGKPTTTLAQTLAQLPPAEQIGQPLRDELESLQNAALNAADPRQQTEALGKLGMTLAAHQVFDQATRVLDLACERTSEFKWCYLAGYAAAELGEPVEAVARYRTACELEPTDNACRARLAQALVHSSQLKEARATLLAILETEPNHAFAHALLGQIELAAGAPDAAREQFLRALEIQPDATALHHQLASIARILGDADEAERRLASAGTGRARLSDPLLALLLESDRTVETLQNRGREALERGDLASAREHFASAQRIAPDDPGPSYNLAVVLMRSGDLRTSIENLERAVAAQASHQASRRLLGELYSRSGRDQEAVDVLIEGLRLDPSSDLLRNVLAASHSRAQRWQQALALYEEIAAGNASTLDETALLDMARCAALIGNEKRALELLGERCRDHCRDPLKVALVKILAGARDAGLRHAARALELSQELISQSRDALVAEARAMALAESGDFSGAIELQRALLSAAERASQENLATRLAANLERFEGGQSAKEPGL